MPAARSERRPAGRRAARLGEARADHAWLHRLRARAPALCACIDPARIDEARRTVRLLSVVSTDFESAARGGRGELFRLAQKATLVRAASSSS
jgi:hypothetical protein